MTHSVHLPEASDFIMTSVRNWLKDPWDSRRFHGTWVTWDTSPGQRHNGLSMDLQRHWAAQSLASRSIQLSIQWVLHEARDHKDFGKNHKKSKPIKNHRKMQMWRKATSSWGEGSVVDDPAHVGNRHDPRVGWWPPTQPDSGGTSQL